MSDAETCEGNMYLVLVAAAELISSPPRWPIRTLKGIFGKTAYFLSNFHEPETRKKYLREKNSRQKAISYKQISQKNTHLQNN